jgi:hypothetical protein
VKWLLVLSALALGCSLSVEGANADAPIEETTGLIGDGTETGAFDCGEIHDADACIAAGCSPLETLPVVYGAALDAAVECEIGDPVVVCSPAEEALECEEARACGAGREAWAMPMPDGSALVAIVELSCGLPRGFLPCPEPGTPDALIGGNAAADSTTDDAEGGGSDDPLALACECACG